LEPPKYGGFVFKCPLFWVMGWMLGELGFLHESI